MDTKKTALTKENVLDGLDSCYKKSLDGLPTSKSCYELAEEYMSKYDDKHIAAKEFIKYQIAKCTTSGFITSLGGIITMPIAIPANLASVWYVQLRMIATLAVIGGYEPSDDKVQTLAYLCLTGSSMSKICRDAGVQFTNKLTLSMIKKIPGATLTKINQKVSFRFVTKFGTKGIVNLGKMVPIAGGLVGGGIDLVGTKIISENAYKAFLSE